jgi:hypothetical protein
MKVSTEDKNLCISILKELMQKENEFVLLWKKIEEIRNKYAGAENSSALDNVIRDFHLKGGK